MHFARQIRAECVYVWARGVSNGYLLIAGGFLTDRNVCMYRIDLTLYGYSSV